MSEKKDGPEYIVFDMKQEERRNRSGRPVQGNRLRNDRPVQGNCLRQGDRPREGRPVQSDLLRKDRPMQNDRLREGRPVQSDRLRQSNRPVQNDRLRQDDRLREGRPVQSDRLRQSNRPVQNDRLRQDDRLRNNRPPQTAGAQRKKRQARRRRRMRRLWGIAVLLMLCLGIIWCYPKISQLPGVLRQLPQKAEGLREEVFQGIKEAKGEEAAQHSVMTGNENTAQDSMEEELKELLEKNEETRDFVEGYPDREKYRNQPIDLSGDYESGKVPLLMQWDRRWGYDDYGDSIIGLSGCGPTCLTMAYLYFTGDIQCNPRTMSEFAYEKGYFVSGATSWNIWTQGVEELGLHGEELPLDENRMKNALDWGGLIVCSMRPGDFTTTGHFILLTGYDENGFYVNDPNRRSTSAIQWSYADLSWQIKNLWAITD